MYSFGFLDQVCLPYKSGGLSIKKLEDFNVALSAK